MRRTAFALLAAVVACGGTATSATHPDPGTDTAGSVTVVVPAAGSFDEPGFHHAVVASGILSTDVPAGGTLVLSLRDAGRPDATCAGDHPLSGCVTVDWSDSPERPHVPPSGVFDNHVTIGDRSWFLSETGVLTDQPDGFAPG